MSMFKYQAIQELKLERLIGTSKDKNFKIQQLLKANEQRNEHFIKYPHPTIWLKKTHENNNNILLDLKKHKQGTPKLVSLAQDVQKQSNLRIQNWTYHAPLITEEPRQMLDAHPAWIDPNDLHPQTQFQHILLSEKEVNRKTRLGKFQNRFKS